MNNTKKRIIITEDEFTMSNAKYDLTRKEGEDILAAKEAFKKLLIKCKLNYQLALGRGAFKDREKDAYRSFEVCDEISKDIDSIELGFIKYKNEQEKKQREEEAKVTE